VWSPNRKTSLSPDKSSVRSQKVKAYAECYAPLPRVRTKSTFASFVVASLTCLVCFIHASRAQAQAGTGASPVITQNIDESQLVTLRGNTRAETTPGNDRGRAANNLPMEHMLLQLRRPSQQEQELQQYIEQLQDPKSPNYHYWLTADQFGERFG